MTLPVLIAGAGPVGLSAACVLAAAGIPVRVFEAEPALPENLRASTFHPPTLDMLARFGASQRLIEMGRAAPTVQYRDRTGWKVTFDFGWIADLTAHPFRVQCEQYRLNFLLADWLASRPHARLELGAAVTGVTQDDAGVVATIQRADGVEHVRGCWLIGADGGRSRVRESIGVPLEGFTWEDRFLVASTPFEFADVMPDLADVSYFADPDQWFFLLRVVGLWRAMFPVRAGESEADILSDDGIERRLQRVWPKSARYEIRHRTLYSVHQRVAQSYRRGRVFLAGDAAHLNNPLGGMGMNGGIHDAFNLAEKLVRVWRGDASESLLERYEAERRPIALEYVNTITIANKRNLETRDPDEQRRWRESMDRAVADRALARDYLKRISMIASLERAAAASPG
jgi:3-(3-hydroxy-phenyl)propionate hydroxylase